MNDYASAVIAALSALSGAGMTHYFSQRQWRSQQQWAVRERHYMDLLRQLTVARLSLTQQWMYVENALMGEVSEKEKPQFFKYGKDAQAALKAVEELSGPARVFLSRDATCALEALVVDDWNASMDSMHVGEYIEKALGLVKKAEAAVLAAATADLNE